MAVDPGQPARAVRSRQSGWLSAFLKHLAPTVLTALLLGLAFPAPGWWPLAYVALAPLGVSAVRSNRPWTLMLATLAAFSGFWLIRINWLIPVTGGGYVGLAVFMAVYAAVAAGLLHWLVRRYAMPAVVALPLAWVTLELIRANLPAGGFGWFVLGHSQAAYLPGGSAGRMVQMADLGGELLVSFYLAMTSGLIVDLLTRPLLRPGRHGRPRLRKTVRAALLVWGVATGLGLAYGQYRISQTDQTSRPGPRVAVVQTDVPQDNRNTRDAQVIAQDWLDLLEVTAGLAEQQPRPDLVVWPETMTPGPINREIRDLSEQAGEQYPGGLWGSLRNHETIAQMSDGLNVNMLVGAVAYDEIVPILSDTGVEALVPSRRANAVQHYGPEGRQNPLRYDKQHLVPFGEFIPWVSASPQLKRLFLRLFSPYGEEVDYTVQPGRRAVVFEMPYVQPEAPAATFAVGTPICYEDVSPGVVRSMVYGVDGRKRADLLANLTNSAWYAGTSQRWQHLQISTMRTIETRVPMARSVNTGISGYIDAAGRVHEVLVPGDAGVLVAEVMLDSRSTVYGRVGRWPAFVMAGVTVLLAIGGLMRGRMGRLATA